MNTDLILPYYLIIGLVYWCINFFVRKLHRNIAPEVGWWLSLAWWLGWIVCIPALVILSITKAKNKYF